MWLLPSKGRPANLARFFAACRATGATTPGMVLIDHADYESRRADYKALDLPLAWTIRQTAAPTQGAKIREVWDEVRDCAWLGLIGDDNIPVTHGWDRLLVDKLTGWNFVSCNDQWQAPRRVANCWVMSGPLVREVGYIFPRGVEHLFVDDVWETIGREAGCWSCHMDVVVQHAHVLKGEAAADETYRAVYGDGAGRGGGFWAADGQAYKEWLEGDRKRVVEAVRGHHAAPTPDAEQQARMDRVRSRKVMILTPIHDRPAWQYLSSSLETIGFLTRMGIANRQQFVIGNSNLPRARNELVAEFLASDCTDAILIDDDMGWRVNDILRLLASDKPVIGAVGRKKVDKPLNDPSIWCVRMLPGSEDQLRQDEMGAVEVEGVGTGFLKIERSVFERLIEAHPDWKLRGRSDQPDSVRASFYKFFRFPEDEFDTGEDYAFCKAWRDLGGEVWVDPTIDLTHAGLHGFTGCWGDLLTPAAETKAA